MVPSGIRTNLDGLGVITRGVGTQDSARLKVAMPLAPSQRLQLSVRLQKAGLWSQIDRATRSGFEFEADAASPAAVILVTFQAFLSNVIAHLGFCCTRIVVGPDFCVPAT